MWCSKSITMYCDYIYYHFLILNSWKLSSSKFLIVEFIRSILIFHYYEPMYRKNSSIIIFFKIFDENRLIKYAKLLLFNIKLVSPVQKYPHCIESCAWILNMFGAIFLLPTNCCQNMLLYYFNITSNPTSSIISKFIKIYYMCPHHLL